MRGRQKSTASATAVHLQFALCAAVALALLPHGIATEPLSFSETSLSSVSAFRRSLSHTGQPALSHASLPGEYGFRRSLQTEVSLAAAPSPSSLREILYLAQARTTRVNPLDSFRLYSYGWNPSNKDYWAVSGRVTQNCSTIVGSLLELL